MDDYTKKLEDALSDLLDGASWEEIQSFTGLPEETMQRDCCYRLMKRDSKPWTPLLAAGTAIEQLTQMS